MNGDNGTSTQSPQLRALLFTDLCDSLILVERIGDSAAAEVFQQHDRLRWRCSSNGMDARSTAPMVCSCYSTGRLTGWGSRWTIGANCRSWASSATCHCVPVPDYTWAKC